VEARGGSSEEKAKETNDSIEDATQEFVDKEEPSVEIAHIH
jgi:hypothetical protein